MVDYERLQATATRLITKNGRSATARRYSSVANDPAKPWAGTTTENVDSTIRIVDIPALSLRRMGSVRDSVNFVEDTEKQILVSSEVDLRGYNIIIDGGEEFKIQRLEELKPADRSMLWAVDLVR